MLAAKPRLLLYLAVPACGWLLSAAAESRSAAEPRVVSSDAPAATSGIEPARPQFAQSPPIPSGLREPSRGRGVAAARDAGEPDELTQIRSALARIPALKSLKLVNLHSGPDGYSASLGESGLAAVIFPAGSGAQGPVSSVRQGTPAAEKGTADGSRVIAAERRPSQSAAPLSQEVLRERARRAIEARRQHAEDAFDAAKHEAHKDGQRALKPGDPHHLHSLRGKSIADGLTAGAHRAIEAGRAAHPDAASLTREELRERALRAIEARRQHATALGPPMAHATDHSGRSAVEVSPLHPRNPAPSALQPHPAPVPESRAGRKAPMADAGRPAGPKPAGQGGSWNLAFSRGSFSFAQVAQGRFGGLEDVHLKSAGIVVAEIDNYIHVTSLPRALQPAVRAFANKEGAIALKQGVNFFAEVERFTGTLLAFEQAFGIKPGPIRIDGSVGGDFVRHFADGKAASTSKDINDIRIRINLPGFAPAPLAGVVDSGPAELHFQAKDGKIEGSGTTAMHFHLAGRQGAVDTTMSFRDQPAIGEDFVSIGGRLPKPSDLLPTVPNLEVSRLAVDFGIARLADNKTEARFDLAGAAAFKRKPVALKGRFIRDDDKKPFIEIAISSATLSIADFVPGSVDLPGLDAVKVTEARLRNDFLSLTARFRAEDTTVYLFASQGRKVPNILVVHDRFRFSDYVPLLKGTPIDDLGQLENAMFLYVPKEGTAGDGGARTISFADLPKPVIPKFSVAHGGGAGKVDLKTGLNFFGHLDLQSPGGANAMFEKLGFGGLGQGKLPLSGAIDPAVLRPARDQAKQIAVQIIESIDITAPMPAFKPAHLPSGMEFKRAVFSLKGEKEPSQPDHARVDVGIKGDVVLTIRGSPLDLAGGIEVDKEIGGAAKALKFAASAKHDWQHPLGLQWLSLKEIEISADLEESSQKSKALDFKIDAKASINGKPPIKTEAELIVADGKIEDIVFRLPSRIDVSDLPHIGKLPGADQFAFANLAVSTRELAGDLTWKPKNVTQKAAVYFGGPERDQVTLFYALESFSLGKLIPPLANTEVGRIELPKLVLTLSTHAITQTNIGQVPEEVRRIMAVVSTDPGYRMEVAQGVGILAPLDPKSLSGDLKAALTRLSITDPVVLGGGVGGILSGVPRLNLKARLPRTPIPKTLPRFLNPAKDVGGAFYLAYGGSVVDLGVEVDAEMVLGLANRQPKLVTLQLGVELGGSGGVGIRTLGSVKGTWPNAMGMIGLDLEEVTFKLGVDADSAVEIGMKAQEVVDGDRIGYDILVAAIPEALTPTKLAFAFDAQEFGLNTYLAMGEVYLKTALAQPFFTKLLETTLRKLGDRKAAGSVEWYEQKIRNAPNISQLLPVDQLPVFHFKNIKAKLVMPGSGDPQLDLEPGVALAGQLWFGGLDLGRVDSSLTFTGLKASGDLQVKQIGPLRIDRATVDIDASVGLDPHFKILADTQLLGTRQDVEIAVEKQGLRIHKVEDLGQMGKLTWDAKTVGTDLTHLTDFTIDGSFSSSFGPWLAAQIATELRPGSPGLAHVASDIQAAKQALDRIKALAEARRNSLAAARNALDAVNEKVAKLPGGQTALKIEQWLLNELSTAKNRVAEAESALIKDAEIASYQAAYEAAQKAEAGILNALASLVVNAATVHGSLRDAMAGKPIRLHLDATVSGRNIKLDLEISLTRPSEVNVADVIQVAYHAIKSDIFGKRT